MTDIKLVIKINNKKHYWGGEQNHQKKYLQGCLQPMDRKVWKKPATVC